MPLNREERRRRIAKDDGNDDDRVHLPIGQASSIDCYHHDGQCHTLRHDTETEIVTREQAQQNGKAPCRVCVLENVGKNPGPEKVASLLRMDPDVTENSPDEGGSGGES